MKNLQYVITKKGAKEYLKEEDYQKLLEGYYQTFMKIYGKDLADSFLVMLTHFKVGNAKLKAVKEESSNYQSAKRALEDVKKRSDLKSLFIYNDDLELVGGGRILELKKEATLPDLAIFAGEEKLNREIWVKTIDFLEGYYRDMGNTILYLEIPSGDPVLLGYGANLGYKESTIEGSKASFNTYLIEKDLKRLKDEQFGNYRK